MDAKGKVIWRGRDDYGSENYFQAKPFYQGGGYKGGVYGEGDEWGYVNVRVISRGEEVFIIRNISAIGQILKRQKYYSKGIMQRLFWTGALFVETWKSPEIAGLYGGLSDPGCRQQSGEGIDRGRQLTQGRHVFHGKE